MPSHIPDSNFLVPASGAGAASVSGPASSTDNAIARFDGATGKIIQGSGVIVDDSDNIIPVDGTNLGDATHGLAKLYSANLLLKELDVNTFNIRDAGDTADRNIRCLYLYSEYFNGVSTNSYISCYEVDNYKLRLMAKDNGTGLVEVGRLQSAADPYLQATLPMVLLPIATASLPATPVEGMFTYDATLDKMVYYNGAAWVTTEGAGGGDVVGPASSTDNEIARQHSTTGKVLQTYTSNPPTISDTGDVNIDGDLDVENIVVSGTVDGVDVSAIVSNATHSGEVTGSGALTIANDAVTYAKMQNVSATDKVLGRSTAEAGDVEEIACTAAGRAILDDANAAAQWATLGGDAAAVAAVSAADAGKRVIEVALNGSTALAVTDKAMFRIPAVMNGWNLVAVAACCLAPGSTTGAITITVQNGTTDMLSTNITIDQDEMDTATAATPAVINGATDHVATSNQIWIEVTGAGAAVTYCVVEMTFQLP